MKSYFIGAIPKMCQRLHDTMYHFVDSTCLFISFAFTLLKGDYFYQFYLANLFTLCKHLWGESTKIKQTNKH